MSEYWHKSWFWIKWCLLRFVHEVRKNNKHDHFLCAWIFCWSKPFWTKFRRCCSNGLRICLYSCGECQTLGLAKSIGVSNFSCKKLADFLSFTMIPPTIIKQVQVQNLNKSGVQFHRWVCLSNHFHIISLELYTLCHSLYNYQNNNELKEKATASEATLPTNSRWSSYHCLLLLPWNTVAAIGLTLFQKEMSLNDCENSKRAPSYI